MSPLLVLALDANVAGHLKVALRRHRVSCQKHRLAEPEALIELEGMATEIVSNCQQASASVTVVDVAQDELNDREFLSRSDVRRITGASLSSVDRWIASGKLPSSRHGRIRRIARSDLERFLAAT